MAQSFFTQCPEAVGIVTNEGVLVASNKRFERTVGPSKVLMGTDFFGTCVSKEDHERFKIAMKRARDAHNTPVPDSPPVEGNASDLVEWGITPTVRGCSSIAMGNTGDFLMNKKSGC